MTLSNPDSIDPAGSPPPGEPDLFASHQFLAVGKLHRPHGVRGEMVMEVITDFPERIRPGMQVYVGDERQLLHIRQCRPVVNGMLVLFEELDTSEAAGEWRNAIVAVRADEIPPLPDGEYYHHQLLGLQVVSDTGLELGRVTQILETGANDVCVVRSEDGREVLIPMVEEFVLGIDPAAGMMRVHLLEGLLP
jgi:16S rRNA processing protein RimM